MCDERPDVDPEHGGEPRPSCLAGSSARRRRATAGPGTSRSASAAIVEDAEAAGVGNHRFSSHTMRSPSSVRNGSTFSIVSRVRRDEVGEAAGRDARALGAELARGCAPRCRPPVPRTRRRARTGGPPTVVLPMTVARRRVVDVHEPRRPREERLHRDLDPRRQHAADVLALGRDDVEVRRGAEVDDDDGRAVPLLRRDRVHDAVRPDLARIVVADRDARSSRPARRRGSAREPTSPRPASHSRISTGTVEERQIPSTDSKSRSPPSSTPSSSAVVDRSVASRQWSTSSSPDRAERGLRVAHVDGQKHGRQSNQSPCVRRSARSTATSSSPESGWPIRSASVLCGQPRLLALAAELLDRDVARGVHLGTRDDPARPVLVPHPDVLHPDVEERVARLRHRLDVELVAEVRRVLREHAVAEKREDGRVLALERELELRLELVEVVEVRHRRQSSAARRSDTPPAPGTRAPDPARRAAPARNGAPGDADAARAAPGSSTTSSP